MLGFLVYVSSRSEKGARRNAGRIFKKSSFTPHFLTKDIFVPVASPLDTSTLSSYAEASDYLKNKL